jgi:CheY-like chemotaxis protein
VPLFNKRKILLAGVEPSVQGLVSTFLVTMGWTCTAAATQDAVHIALQRESFDAVLIDLGSSVAKAEQTILRTRQIRPSLADRMLVMRNGFATREMTELIERHGLIPVFQEGLLQHLWMTIQELVAPSRPHEISPRGVQVARIIFDSLESPLPAGIRGSASDTRQIAYQYKQATIDVSVSLMEGANRISLAGQVMDGERKGRNDDLSVLLVDGTGTLARTSTNQFGEFQMEFEPADDLSIEVRLGDGTWVSLPLGKMNWSAKLRSSLRTGS